jgi:cytochrome c oxidase subunit 2
MDAQSLLTLTKVLLAGIFLLVIYNLSLVFKIKQIDPFRNWNATKTNGALMMIFLVVGFIAAAWSSSAWYPDMGLVIDAASEHGAKIDGMFWRTMIVSILVVIVTNVLLFYFAWRYQERKGQKALYYPHNNKLELIWTLVPAVVMTILIADGVRNWHNIMDPDPETREQAIDVEFYGRQFDWTIRYTGPDKELGQTHVKYIDVGSGNQLGFNFDDPKTHDDIVVTEIHLPVNVPVHMHIRSQDVLHSATLAQFRVKMDAVPGMPTQFWFTPTVTTAEMREIKRDPDFEYEMSCQQICGGAHYNMRRVVVVETMEEYQAWLQEQKAFYATYREMNGMNTNTAEATSPEKEEVSAEEGEPLAAVK